MCKEQVLTLAQIADIEREVDFHGQFPIPHARAREMLFTLKVLSEIARSGVEINGLLGPDPPELMRGPWANLRIRMGLLPKDFFDEPCNETPPAEAGDEEG